jgi:hypothetical protein
VRVRVPPPAPLFRRGQLYLVNAERLTAIDDWHRRTWKKYSADCLHHYRQAKKIVVMRLLAIILVTLLLPFSMSVPSAMACPTKACCGPNCSGSAPLNRLSCCQAPTVPDRATSQTRSVQHFDSIGSLPASVVINTISHSRNIVIASGYSPPTRLLSLALLCSRQI